MLLLGSVQAGDRINRPLTARDVCFFWECNQWSLACMGLSASSFSAIQDDASVCHGRPVGLHTHAPLSFNILRHGEGCVPFFFDCFEKQKLLSDSEIESHEGTHYTSIEGSSSHTRLEQLGRFCKRNFGSIFGKVRVRLRPGRVGVIPKKSNRIYRSANRIFFFG